MSEKTHFPQTQTGQDAQIIQARLALRQTEELIDSVESLHQKLLEQAEQRASFLRKLIQRE